MGARWFAGREKPFRRILGRELSGHRPFGRGPSSRGRSRVQYLARLRFEWLEDRSLLSVAPTGVDLLPAYDTGVFSDDNLTKFDNSTTAKRLQFEVSGTVAGATVAIYADGASIGTATATGTTTTVLTNGAGDLADGAHSITARQTEPSQTQSGDSPALSIAVDTAAPFQGEQIAKLTADDGAASDYFGYSVSISGHMAIVGAYYENSFCGSAYLFEDTGSGWVQIAKLTATDATPGNSFGYSVSISGDTAIVGAYRNINGGCGSAYIFQDNGSGWVQVAKLIAADGATNDYNDYFGCSVSISDNTAIVGAYQDDDKGTDSGSAYVFVDTGSGWTQVAKLTASDGAASDHFGYSVSISGNMAIVGAYHDNSLSGSAYLFEDTGSGWAQVAKLIAADRAAGDYFGYSVSISNNVAIVGAYRDDDKGSDSGSAYVFKDPGSGWAQAAKLRAADGAASDYFGRSVSINGNTAIVGAYWDDDKGDDSGSAYVFQDTGLGWNQTSKLRAADGAMSDSFGWSVAISGNTAVVGAYMDDDKGTDSGSAHIFDAAPLFADDTGVNAYDHITSDTTPELTFMFTEPVYGQDSDVTLLDPNGDPVASDSITGWGTDSLAISFSTPLTMNGLYAVTIHGTITDAAGNLMNGGLDETVAFTLDTETPAPPVAPDLQAASDCGVSDTDNLTCDNTPTFDVVGAPFFRLCCDGVQISGDYESGSYTAAALADGTYQYTAIAVDSAGNESAPSAPLVVTIETVAPPTPAIAPDLQVGSDTGMSETDNITSDNTPTFDIAAGPYFHVYRGATRVSDYATGDNCTLMSQPDGTYDYTVTSVDDAGNESGHSASLTVTIDTTWPTQTPREVAKLLAADGAADDRLGLSVSIDGNRAIIGASNDDDKGTDSGAAYVFEGTGSGWMQVAKLTASDGASNDNFGLSVSISGNVAIVGAYKDDDKGTDSGSAYIFQNGSSGWVQIAKLTASDGVASDYFGSSVSIDGDVAIVGAYGDNDKGTDSGSAYVFTNTGSGWVQVAKLTAGDGATGGGFGFSVSISGSIAIIGACGVSGLCPDSAYVFTNTGSGWTQVQKLTTRPDIWGNLFGLSVSIDGTTGIIGAPLEDGLGSWSGAAYVFEDAGSGWIQIAKLTASDGAASDHFGYSVSISGNTVIVGAYQDDDKGSNSGSAYVFAKTGSGWTQVAKLTASDGATGDLFSYTGVSVSGATAIVGSPMDDDRGSNSGSAYVFTLAPALDLQAASDTGSSGTDNVTTDTTPTFDVIGSPYFQVYRDGTQVSGDYESGSTYTATTLPDGTYDYTVTAVDAAGNESPPSETLTVNIDTQAATVQSVLVKGSTWDTDFLDYLDSAGLGQPGVARLGYRVSDGGTQLETLGWGNVDTVTIVFSEDVVVAQGDLAISGVSLGNYSVAGFNYDAANHVATWTLAERIDTDRVSIRLDDVVEDIAGNALDGEWQNGASGFPSGNGAAGGDFRFAFNVLPGDVNHDGTVGAADASIMAANWGYNGTGWAPGDVTGDGQVDAGDAAVLAGHWGTQLPWWLPGDANCSGTVDQADAAILAAHWGLSSMTWADGDFNKDGLVNAADASILAANWGYGVAESSESETSNVPASSDPPAALLVGPVAGRAGSSSRRLLEPVGRNEGIGDALLSGSTVEATAAAADVALVEDYGPQRSQPGLDHHRLAWSYTLARRPSHGRARSMIDQAALAIDLLLAEQ